jgi:murein DD-endopeptidase MepM/ murein hydrolase activator NlpD
MHKSLYRYNAETCQYERIRIKSSDVFFYASGVLVTALGMLAGMLLLHDYIFDSQKEIVLRSENSALVSNSIVLTSQLNSIESTLTALAQKDDTLHAKFFGSKAQEKASGNTLANKQLLLADASAFRMAVEKMNDRSSNLLDKSTATNVFYGSEIELKAETVNTLMSMPVLQPIQPWNSDRVISGFGMRINPFHKGLYEHTGVDITVPKGTAVIATASGTIISVSKSDVQAGYGNYVEIDHGNGFTTRYAHLEEIVVKRHQKISKGTSLGTVGNSGGSIAPHLHYEIVRNGITVDPIPYMIEGLSSTEHNRLRQLANKQNQSLD